jgi:signal transduction histidine kinase
MMTAPPRSWSLNLRMLAIALGVTLLAWAGGAVATIWFLGEQNEVLHDARLADTARVILQFSSHELRELEIEARLTGADPTVHRESLVTLGERYRFQIWSGSRLILRSSNAPDGRPITSQAQEGFGHADLDGREFCTYVMWLPDRSMQIQIAEAEQERDVTLVDIGLPGVAAMLSSIALLVGLSSWALRRSTSSIAAMAQDLARRRPGDTQPLTAHNAPRELQPVTAAVNELFERYAVVLRREREFTAVAAHEMRTPIAGLRTMAQVAMLARTDQERATALEGVMTGVDRCAHLITQLLTLARVDTAVDPGQEVESIDLSSVVRAVADELASEVRARGLELRIDVQEALPPLMAQRFPVQMMVRNLVLNAIQHSPVGAQVAITVGPGPDGQILAVDDAGCGIPEAQRERVFERFRRLGQQGPGVGLGLAIVQSVAHAHQALVSLLDSPLGGLRVEVRFHAAGAD